VSRSARIAYDRADAATVLAQPRRRLLAAIGKERTPTELANHLPLSRVVISQHLGVLLSAGLVTQRWEANRCFYRRDDDAVAALCLRLWTEASPPSRSSGRPVGTGVR
jgi:DNA-binding transcriptional ArsR family regulator